VVKVEDIEDNIRLCYSCPLAATRLNTVPGEGHPYAKLLFIGEAPGAEEDKTGKPFVGRSGALLTKLILGLGMGRGQVFITNIVKCRPPKNRIPELEEVQACKTYLDKQIKAIDPRIIVLMGNVALFSRLKRAGVGRWHGNFFEEEGRTYFVTCHPSAALRSPGWMKALSEDFKTLGLRIQKMKGSGGNR